MFQTLKGLKFCVKRILRSYYIRHDIFPFLLTRTVLKYETLCSFKTYIKKQSIRKRSLYMLEKKVAKRHVHLNKGMTGRARGFTVPQGTTPIHFRRVFYCNQLTKLSPLIYSHPASQNNLFYFFSPFYSTHDINICRK